MTNCKRVINIILNLTSSSRYFKSVTLLIDDGLFEALLAPLELNTDEDQKNIYFLLSNIATEAA